LSADRWERPLRALGCAALIGALAYRIVDSGPLRLEAPRTAASLTQPALDDLLVFLRRVEGRVPPGAEIALVPARREAVLTPLMFHYLALGQLPGHRVLYAEVPHFPSRPPEYVAVYGAGLDDQRYVLVEKLESGSLYRRAP
jgi:hypothetical protein